jgi:hypothetical protein
MKPRNPFADVSSASSRLPLVAVLVLQSVVAYEWLNSAFTKIVHGGFAAGLADQLAKNADGAPGWYRAVLEAVIIPHAAIFGYLIEAGELLVGASLIATAAVLFVRGQHLSVVALRTLLGVVAVTALGGAFMNLNFSLFSGDPAPWSLGSDAFSEGVGIDGILMLVQLAMAGATASLAYSLRDRRAVRTLAAPGRERRVAGRAA